MKQKDLLFLVISTFIIVIAWIGFSIYHNSTTSTIPSQLNTQIIPIPPDFDTKTINTLKAREQVAPIYAGQKTVPTQGAISPTPTAVLTTTPIPAASGSGQVTPTASPSGTIPPGFGNRSP